MAIRVHAIAMRDGGLCGLGGYQWATQVGASRITITCHNLSDVGKPDAAVFDALVEHIPCARDGDA